MLKKEDVLKEVRNDLGELHSEVEPAIVFKNGNKQWFFKNKIHRSNDLPAIENANGDKFWYKDGVLHRLNGPSGILKSMNVYAINGVEIEENSFLKAPKDSDGYLSSSEPIMLLQQSITGTSHIEKKFFIFNKKLFENNDDLKKEVANYLSEELKQPINNKKLKI